MIQTCFCHASGATLWGAGNEKNAKLPPERQMASEAPANGFAHGNEVDHLFLGNVNEAEQYKRFVQGS